MTTVPPSGVQRPTPARMARIHLRVGLVTLARAELETMAGRGELDGPALADLAEARWRTGDLPGAGEAARAHLDGGGDEPIAEVVAAEAEAARGRFAEARALAMRVQARDDLGSVELDRLLMGRARAPFWPQISPLAEAPTAGVPTAETAPAAPAAIAPSSPEPVELPPDPGVVAARLGLLLRERSLPPAAVLEQADAALAALPAEVREGPAGGALHLVRGDAYRQMGREEQASAAYRACWTALENLPPGPTQEEVP